MFEPLGSIASLLLGGANAPLPSEQMRQRNQAMLRQQQMLHDMQMREFARRAKEDQGDYVDVEFTILDDQPQITDTKLIEDKGSRT